jgi:hypothetical protein
MSTLNAWKKGMTMNDGKVLSELLLECCFICDDLTGRAGEGEDSLYCDECDKGPYCSNCFRKHHESDAKVAQLEDEIVLKADYIKRLEERNDDETENNS